MPSAITRTQFQLAGTVLDNVSLFAHDIYSCNYLHSTPWKTLGWLAETDYFMALGIQDIMAPIV